MKRIARYELKVVAKARRLWGKLCMVPRSKAYSLCIGQTAIGMQ